jgi:phosphohistidine phosphatase
MELYLLRHGIAADRGAGDDAQRALTAAGRPKLRQVLERAARVKVSPSLILSSPYLRAVETAGMAAKILPYRKKIVQTEALLPEAAPDAFWEEIRARRHEGAILAAGHEPMLSATVAYLMGAPTMRIDMKKGALARIDLDGFGPRPQGVLRWLLTPRLAAGSKG